MISMVRMKKFLTALVLVGSFFAGEAFADEDFDLAKSVVDILSTGAYYVKYRENPANFVPVRVYSVKDGMVATYLEKNSQHRDLSRGGDLYRIDDQSKIMEIHEGRGNPSMFGSAPYTFAGRGEKEEGDQVLRYEEAVMDDGRMLRFFFSDSETTPSPAFDDFWTMMRSFSGGSALAQIEIVSSDGRGFLLFITEFGAIVTDNRVFNVPQWYDVRKTFQQLKQDAQEGIMPDDPVDRLMIQMSISEDERLKRAAEERDFRSELVGGMWHSSPSLGSGWSQRLGFLDDSTFIYAASEMDGESRERFITGEWSLNAEGLLTLNCREALKWEGGEVVPAMGSTGTKTEIIKADLRKVKFDPVKKIEIHIGDYIYDDSTPRPWKISLPDGGAIWSGDGWWWKYEGDKDLENLDNDYKNTEEKAAK